MKTLKKNLKNLVTVVSVLFIGSAYAGPGHNSHGHDDKKMNAGGHHQNMMQDEAMGDTGGHGHRGGHHDGGHHGHGHGAHHGESIAGKPGKEKDVDRVVNVEANDAMRFVHEPFKIKNGETIKFVISNKGAVPHEFAIGTKDEHMEHGEMMMKNPNMHHGPGGNAITIAPGETENLIWTFEEAWEVEAACNIPGHYQAGMHSPVVFSK